MKEDILTHWEQLQRYLPEDLETSAREFGAFQRARGIPDATTLLRLLLVYSGTPLSFRQTVAWAQAQDIAHLSDVSLIERMTRCEPWLLHLLQQMLPDTSQHLATVRRICLVDGTTVSAPTGEYWRLQVVYNGHMQQMEQLVLTDSRTAERLEDVAKAPAENVLYVADRGYAKPGGIEALLASHAHLLCRIKGRDYLQYADPNQTVTVVVPKGRVFIVPVPEEKKGQIDKRLKRKASKRQSKLKPETLVNNHYWFLFCSDNSLSAEQAVALYQWRWQVELLFKRLKSLQGLDDMTVKSPILCRVYLLCHGILALIAQQIQSLLKGSFPPEAIEAAVSLACLAIRIPVDTSSAGALAVSESA